MDKPYRRRQQLSEASASYVLHGFLGMPTQGIAGLGSTRRGSLGGLLDRTDSEPGGPAVSVAQSLPSAAGLPLGEGVPDLPVAPAALSKYRRVLY
jgi:hypothetical protein